MFIFGFFAHEKSIKTDISKMQHSEPLDPDPDPDLNLFGNVGFGFVCNEYVSSVFAY